MTFKAIGQTEQTLAGKKQNEDGLCAGKTTSVETRRNSSEIAAWLVKHSPADLDKAAVSRAQSHGVTLNVRTEYRYPTGENGERLPSYPVATGCEVHGTDDQRRAALSDLKNFTIPAPIREIEKWIAELSVITAGRGREGFDAELLINAYSSRLAQFPADVAKYALLKKSWKWFPTWDELEKICAAKSGPRLHMISALMRPAPEPEPERRPATKEEKDRIAKLIAEQFPNVPQSWRDKAADQVTDGNSMVDDAKDELRK